MSFGNTNSAFQLSAGDLNQNNKIAGSQAFMDGLMNSGWRWGNGASTNGTVTQVINYYFYESTGTKPARPSTWSSHKSDVVDALATWENVANIDFVEASTKNGADILLHNTTEKTIASYAGYSGTPNQTTTTSAVNATETDLKNSSLSTTFRVGRNGQVYTYFPGQDNGDYLPQGSPTGWGHDSAARIDIIHEIGHALGLKHPHDGGTVTPAAPNFPGVTGKKDGGLGGLNSNIHSIMSENKDSTFKGFPGTPMAFDIAAIQLLYGANKTFNNGDNVYVMHDPTINLPVGSNWGQDGKTFSCIWDTGGTDEIAYAGAYDAIIDLRPATLTGVAGAGGRFSYTQSSGGRLGLGYSIAGDITNALANVNGVTGVIIENATGGFGNDTIRGNDVGNVLHGGVGKDNLLGYGGADKLYGDAGKDYLAGGEGSDDYFLLELSQGKYDTVFEKESAGKDTVHVQQFALGGPDHYTLTKGVERGFLLGTGNGFTLEGNDLDNYLEGSNYNDKLVGRSGDDTLYGVRGYDILIGGFGNDTYVIDHADVTSEEKYSLVVEGFRGGTDTVLIRRDFSSSITSYTLEANVENGKILGPGFELIGNSLNNKLWGGEGGDILRGGIGADKFYGNDDELNSGGDSDPHSIVSASDDFYGGVGNDEYFLYEAALAGGYSTIHENFDEGNDTVHVLAAFNGAVLIHAYTLADNVENGIVDDAGGFILTGNGLANDLRGGDGNDGLIGDDGADVLRGGNGADGLVGGNDGDTYYLEDVTVVNNDGPTPEYGYDTITEYGEDTGIDVVHVRAAGVPDFPLSVITDYALASFIEEVHVDGDIGMSILGNGIGVDMFGSTGDDTLIGGNGVNTLRGREGKDTLIGGNFEDTLLGGAGRDTLTGGGDRDTFVFRAASDSTRGSGRDVITDFTQGNIETRDLIDLSAIDANTRAADDQAFHLIGTDPFSSDRRHHVYGELRYFHDASSTVVEGDIDGDGRADFQVKLSGPTIELADIDFRL